VPSTRPEEGGAVNPSCEIIVVCNQKGGVAKTTTSVSLATCLGGQGYRTLLVDLDPQGGCCTCLGLDAADLATTIYDVLIKRDFAAERAIVPMQFGFDLLPSNTHLAGAEVELRQVLSMETVLRRKLAPLRERYDYIVLDTPPSLGIMTVNALTAGTSALIPIACEYMALRGFADLLETIDNVRTVLNPDLRILGVLGTRFDARTNHQREVYEYLGSYCTENGLRLFDTPIKASTRFTEAPTHRIPLVLLHKDLDGARAYQKLAEEISREHEATPYLVSST
jgi:chromosome partitioning protein